jgi:glycosyltransferase involved in cell wall biosynthesis
VKVAVLTHFFPPEACAAATRVQSLADALLRAGNDVTIIAPFPSFPQGRLRSEDRFKVFERKRDGARTTVRVFSLVARIPGGRLMQWVTASIAAAAYVVFTRRRYDVVIASMPPITLALPALIGAWRHRAKLVVDVRDVFPDIAIAMGEWRRDGLLARTAEYVVRRLYRRADLIVAVTPTAISQIGSRGVDPSRLVLARNAAEEAPAVPRPVRNGKPFTAIYAGNLGVATDVDLLLDAASQLKSDGIRLEIVGDGAQAHHARDRVQREALTNVAFSGVLPRLAALERIAAADVALVPLRAGITESVPTKLYDALSVGCPVIVAAGGEAANEGKSLGAVCTAPGDAQSLAHAIRRLSQLSASDLVELGNRGRAAVQERRGRASIMAELCDRISSLCT